MAERTRPSGEGLTTGPPRTRTASAWGAAGSATSSRSRGAKSVAPFQRDRASVRWRTGGCPPKSARAGEGERRRPAVPLRETGGAPRRPDRRAPESAALPERVAELPSQGCACRAVQPQQPPRPRCGRRPRRCGDEEQLHRGWKQGGGQRGGHGVERHLATAPSFCFGDGLKNRDQGPDVRRKGEGFIVGPVRRDRNRRRSRRGAEGSQNRERPPQSSP